MNSSTPLTRLLSLNEVIDSEGNVAWEGYIYTGYGQTRGSVEGKTASIEFPDSKFGVVPALRYGYCPDKERLLVGRALRMGEILE
jgi:hypothetical protein